MKVRMKSTGTDEKGRWRQRCTMHEGGVGRWVKIKVGRGWGSRVFRNWTRRE